MAESSSQKPVEKAADTAQKVTTSPPKRKYRTFLFQLSLVAAIAAFGGLTFMVKTTPLWTLDVQIAHAVQSIDSPLFATLMDLVSWPGFSPQSYMIAAIIVVAIYWAGLHWEAVSALVAAVLPPVVNVLVKDLVQRPRPAVNFVHVFKILDSYSFPSGHVMFYVGFFGFLLFLAFTLLKRSLLRTLLLIFFGSLIALVGISRIYLGEHWPSDVLGAYLLGGIILAALIQFYHWGKKRFFAHQPVASEQPKIAPN